MLVLCVAVAKNNIIGRDNKLLWHISEDLKRFKQITMNKTMIMGRKTFESLPGILPGRKHVVLTRDKNFKVDSENVVIVHTLEEIINNYSNTEEEAFVIGGGQLYKSTIEHCKKIYLTNINKDFEGDTYFPAINYNDWDIVYSSEEKINPKDNLTFKFVDLIRK